MEQVPRTNSRSYRYYGSTARCGCPHVRANALDGGVTDLVGILEHAPLETRVAWVRDLFAHIDVDSREGKAVAVWKAATDPGVSRSDSVSSWLWRAGASRLLTTRGVAGSGLCAPPPDSLASGWRPH